MNAKLSLLVAVAALVLGACAATPTPPPATYGAAGPPHPACVSAACAQNSNMYAANWYSGA